MSVYDWSTTAASNASADSDINWAEGQAPSTVNDSARYLMQKVAFLMDNLTGQSTSAGSGNAYTLTSGESHSALPAGFRCAFLANHANTGAATLNVDTIGAVTIKKHHDQDLQSGDIESGQVVEVVYDGTNYQMLSPAASQLDAGDVGTIASQDADNVAITGGAIDGTVIGGSTAAAGTFTTITGTDDLAIDTDTLFVDVSTGRVGIQTATPTFELDVVGQHQTTHTGQQVLRVRRDTSATYTVADVTSYTKNASSAYIAAGAHGFGLADTTASTEDGYYRLAIMEAGSSNTAYSIVGAGNHAWRISNSELMRLDDTGLGLGTTSPIAPLHAFSGSATIAVFERSTTGNSAIQMSKSDASLFVGISSSGEFAINDNADLDNAPAFSVDPTSGEGSFAGNFTLDSFFSQSLGTTAGDTLDLLTIRARTAGNQIFLRTVFDRTQSGSDWTTSKIKMMHSVDVTNFGYLSFGTDEDADGVGFGNGIAAEHTRMDGTGNWFFSNRLTISAAGNSTTILANNLTGDGIITSRGGSGYGSFAAIGSGTNPAYLFLQNDTSGERGRVYADNSGILYLQAVGSTVLVRNNGGTELACFNTTGLGIGNTSPDHLLDVAGDAQVDGLLGVTEGATLQIASGVITVTGSFHEVISQTPTSPDTLDTINGGHDGAILILRADNDQEDVISISTAGNITCAAGLSITADDNATFIYSATLSKWLQISTVNI